MKVLSQHVSWQLYTLHTLVLVSFYEFHKHFACAVLMVFTVFARFSLGFERGRRFRTLFMKIKQNSSEMIGKGRVLKNHTHTYLVQNPIKVWKSEIVNYHSSIHGRSKCNWSRIQTTQESRIYRQSNKMKFYDIFALLWLNWLKQTNPCMYWNCQRSVDSLQVKIHKNHKVKMCFQEDVV